MSDQVTRPKSVPAIPLFGDAYIADTRHLSLEEHGAYLQLLMIAWRTEDCALPEDDKRLAQMLAITTAKWAKIKPVVMAFWSIDNGRWVQKRLTKERKFVSEKRAKNVEAANERWNRQPTENKQTAGSERISGRISERICQNDAPPPPPLKSKTKPNGLAKKPMPDDWVPSEFGAGSESREIVDSWDGAERRRQLETFRAHHRANGSRFVDWQQAWSTWALNSRKFERHAPARGEPQTLLEVMAERRRLDAIVAERKSAGAAQ